ncbi:hypothetical protein GLOIN_2v1481061 [Rhizophagus clarus]|uniref:Uncharacterized protein n=1 Tax=Rhizophagus clarus TaxID=94130 RepID=A0A8H3R4X9_9GLOM|nr:hypothetical protein GLOIN_2v1481061 [Rhizophagus clarus]
MSTRSTRSSVRNTKRSSSNINNNNQEMIKSTNNATQVNNNPQEDNASVSTTSTPKNDPNRHETSNKRVRTTEGSNNDVLMTENTSLPDTQTQTDETTTPKTPVLVSLNESLHAPKNDGNPLITAPNEDHSGANPKTGLSNKGKNKITDTNQDTLMHEQLDLKFLDYFVLSIIFPIMINHTSALDGVNIGSLRVTFHDFNKENTSNIIKQELTNIFNRSIKFVDIPQSYPTKVFVNIVQNQYGNILTYKEIIRQRRNTTQQQRPNQRNYKPQPPTYKQIHIVFKDIQPVKNFFAKEIYSLKIENWVCRILPADHSHPEHDKRSKFGYKITGLPMNTQLGDLHPILTRINAQTCTFAPTNNRQLQKAAYVYVKKKDYKDQIFRIKCFNTIIYVFPQNIRLSCTICGDPTHEYTNCTNKQDPN